jgi:hypothetical protein
VTDFPYLAFAANRLVPPQLVEASLTRIRAGSLTDRVAIEESSRHDPAAVLFWWDRLARLPEYKRWVDEHFQVVRVFAADGEAVSTLYLPIGADLARVRPLLLDGLPNASDAQFGNGLILLRWGLDRSEAAPGDARSLSLAWQATEQLPRDLSAVLTLRSTEDVVWTSERLPLLGSGDGRRGWAPGRWLLWSGAVHIPPRLEAGSYVLSVRVTRGDSSDFLPVTVPGPRVHLEAEDPKGMELASIAVAGPVIPRRSPRS